MTVVRLKIEGLELDELLLFEYTVCYSVCQASERDLLDEKTAAQLVLASGKVEIRLV